MGCAASAVNGSHRAQADSNRNQNSAEKAVRPLRQLEAGDQTPADAESDKLAPRKQISVEDNSNGNAFKSHAGHGGVSTLCKKTEVSPPEVFPDPAPEIPEEEHAGSSKKEESLPKEPPPVSGGPERPKQEDASPLTPRPLSLQTEKSETWSEVTICASEAEHDGHAQEAKDEAPAPAAAAAGAAAAAAADSQAQAKSGFDSEIDVALLEIQLNLEKAERKGGSCQRARRPIKIEVQEEASKPQSKTKDAPTSEPERTPAAEKPVDTSAAAAAPSASASRPQDGATPDSRGHSSKTFEDKFPMHFGGAEGLQVSTITSVTSTSVVMYVPSDKPVRPNTPLPARLQRRLEATKTSWKHSYNCEEKQMIAAAFREEEKEKRLRKAREYEERRRQVQSRRNTNIQHALEEELLNSASQGPQSSSEKPREHREPE